MRGVAIRLLVACVASGCGFSIEGPSASPGDGGGEDGDRGDGGGTIDVPTPFGCFGTGIVVVCPITQPPPSYDVTVETRFDTTATSNCTAVNGTNVSGTCVVIAERVTISAKLRAVGTRPLIIVATDELAISSDLDIASHRDGEPGAGATTAVCQSGSTPSASALGSGGGAGGSYSGAGGIGGMTLGGVPGPATAAPGTVRGGCRGQEGANAIGDAGDGGWGGGALYLIAKTQIRMTGTINASGAGGEGATPDITGSGGGGGGSGGMIMFDAPMVDITSQVFANGGGGGGGSANFFAGGGGDDSTSATDLADGGGGGGTGGDGGRGTANDALDGMPGGNIDDFSVAGGGGGGGAAGYIRIYGTRTGNGTIAPPPIL